MGQLHSRLTLSVGTKLLLSHLALLVVLVASVSWSAIAIIGRDKQEESSQARITEATLAGTEFANSIRNSMDSIRPLLFADGHVLERAVDSQSHAILLANGTLDLASFRLKIRNSALKSSALQDLSLGESALTPSDSQLRALTPDLSKNGYALLNLTRDPSIPLLAILLSLPRLDQDSGKLPVVLLISQMRKLAPEISHLNLTIATRSGSLLFGRGDLAQDPLFQAARSQSTFGTKTFEVNTTRYLGAYVFPGFDLVVMTRDEWPKIMNSAYALTEQIVLVGILAALVAVIFALLFSRQITAPLSRLYEATQQIARGNFQAPTALGLDTNRTDEFGELARSFQSMSAQIGELFSERTERIALESELEIASTVQKNFLPDPTFRNERIQIHSHYQSASQCGGDWWGFFEVGDRMIFGIADTTGHGLPSALLTASARSCFSVLQKMAEEDETFNFSPARMLDYTNRVIFDANAGRVNMTFFLGVLDFNRMTLDFASAGHNPPWILRETEQGTELKSLVARGTRLGEFRDAPPFEEKSVHLRPHDLLFLYTDGVLEGRDRAGTIYGKKRLRAFLQSEAQQSTDHVVEHLMADFSRHTDGTALVDDVTVACARILRGTA